MFKKKTAMKKTYQIPEMKIVKVQTAQMVAASLGVQGDAEGSTMLSRQRGSLWDDDDDE